MTLVRPIAFASIASLGLALAGCGAAPAVDPDDDGSDYELVPEGKADNYRSPTAMEFSARATATVVLGADMADKSEAERREMADELVSAKLLQIGWFLNLWVADKEDEDANRDYGGFHAMARNTSVKSLKVEATDATTYRFDFEATIAAQNDFLRLLPGEQDGTARKTSLAMGKLSNETLLSGSWQSGFDLHSWKPGDDASTIETLPLVVAPMARSQNAYLDYKALYADGKLEVGAQFGWDYNAGRQDLANAEQLYDELVAAGFASPVASFAELALDSPPLTRKSLYAGEPVDVSVKLVHPGMVGDPAADAVKLRAALIDLLATREVVLFNGHAGTSGRLLPADFRSTSAGNIMPAEYATLKLLPGYQILLIEGCQTYARFTDGFRQNPLKRGPNGELVNMDIVTSTSYTWTSQGAESMMSILWPLVGRSATRLVEPKTWDDVLREMNEAPSETAFMGVNGIDNDPHAHPYGSQDKLGARCTSRTTCGGLGNLCFKKDVAASGKICGSVCLDDAGCPSNYKCAQLATGGTLAEKACVKR